MVAVHGQSLFPDHSHYLRQRLRHSPNPILGGLTLVP
jgi:hypothetical protein